MYKLSYEKCVCFLFLVILVFLSCSGFHTDRLVTLTDHHNNKKYPFTSSYNSLNENAGHDSDELIARLMSAEMETTSEVRKWYTRFGGGMHFAGVPGAGASLTEGVDQLPPRYPPPSRYHRRRHLTRRNKQRTSNVEQENPSNSINTKTHPVRTTTHPQQQQQQQTPVIQENPVQINHEESPESELIREKRAAGRGNNRERRRRNERKFCPGQDVGTRAFHAKTIIEGRVRSMKNRTNASDYAVTVEVKKIHRNESNFRALNITDIIRLHFANGQHKGCDQKLVHGLVPAQLDNGNYYIFFLKSVAVHNYTVIGQPVPYDAKKVRQIQDVINKKKVRAAKILNPGNSNELTIKQNEQLKLTCIVRGNPPPIVTWYKDGSEIRGGKRKKPRIKYMEKKSVLLIPRVDSSDAGKYECRAKGVIGKAVSSSTSVTIQKDHSEFPEDVPCPQDKEFCLNGGTCFFYRSLGEYACRCSNGFNGQRCEHKDVTSQTSTYTRTVYCKLGLSNTFYC